MNTPAIIGEGRFLRNILEFVAGIPPGSESEADTRRKCDFSL